MIGERSGVVTGGADVGDSATGPAPSGGGVPSETKSANWARLARVIASTSASRASLSSFRLSSASIGSARDSRSRARVASAEAAFGRKPISDAARQSGPRPPRAERSLRRVRRRPPRADLIDHSCAVRDGLSDLRSTPSDQRGVPGAEVEHSPVRADVEVGPAGKVP